MDDSFAQKIISLRGEVGREWLAKLPKIINKCEQEWCLTVQSPFTLSYNYVCPATTQDGQDVVLKISFPENNEFATEIEALKNFSQTAVIQILKEDVTNGVVLLERARPGTALRTIVPDEEQIHAASETIKNLHIPLSPSVSTLFPTLHDWAKAFDRYKEKYSVSSGPVPQELFNKSEGIFREFLEEKREQVLLHGDLHSDNILSSQRGWLVIDPKGIVGEREFELGAYLRNPYYDFPEGSDYHKLESNRIAQLAEELGFDKVRIQKWAFACAVISLLWFLEDENTFNEIYVRNAELIDETP